MSTGSGTASAVPGSGVGPARAAGRSTGSPLDSAMSGCGVGPIRRAAWSTDSHTASAVPGSGVGPVPAAGRSTGSPLDSAMSGCGVGPVPAAGMSTGYRTDSDSATRRAARARSRYPPPACTSLKCKAVTRPSSLVHTHQCSRGVYARQYGCMASILSSEEAPPSMDHAAARLCSTVWSGAARVLKVGETVGVGVTVGVKVGRGVAVDLGVDTAVRGKVGGAVGVGVKGDRGGGAVGVSTAAGSVPRRAAGCRQQAEQQQQAAPSPRDHGRKRGNRHTRPPLRAGQETGVTAAHCSPGPLEVGEFRIQQLDLITS